MKYGVRTATSSPRRRWLQFNLKSMLLVMTLLATVLGVRVACLRFVADYHRKGATERLAWLQRTDRTPEEEAEYEANKFWLNWHIRWRDAYDRAVYQPWKFVKEEYSPNEMP